MQERRGWAPVQCGDVLVADLHHFLDMPHDASGPARRLAQHLGDIVRAGTAGEVGDRWVSALPCRRRPAHRRCPGRMTIAIASAEASAPIRWSCSVCDDEGVISNWADSPYDLRRRGLSLADALEEVIVSDKTAADEIARLFGVSKGNFKKAIGGLYKQGRIVIHPDRIELA